MYDTVARRPARLKRKIATMYRIYCVLPARFNEILKRTSVRSPTTVSKRLREMETLGIVDIEVKTREESLRSVPYNIYKKNPLFEDFMEETRWSAWLPNITAKMKFRIKVLNKMKIKVRIKKRGKKTRKIELCLLDQPKND